MKTAIRTFLLEKFFQGRRFSGGSVVNFGFHEAKAFLFRGALMANKSRRSGLVRIKSSGRVVSVQAAV